MMLHSLVDVKRAFDNGNRPNRTKAYCVILCGYLLLSAVSADEMLADVPCADVVYGDCQDLFPLVTTCGTHGCVGLLCQHPGIEKMNTFNTPPMLEDWGGGLGEFSTFQSVAGQEIACSLELACKGCEAFSGGGQSIFVCQPQDGQTG